MDDKMKQKAKRKTIIYMVIALVGSLAIIVGILFYFNIKGEEEVKRLEAAEASAAATEAATEFTIVPCTDEEAASLSKGIVGAWSSYNKEGEPYTYSFDKDGKVRYQIHDHDPIDYTYTVKDGYLTIQNDDSKFVYQCSKDAVGMMARLHNGEWQTDFTKIAETVPDFNGCVYIDGDILYLGKVCLCRSDALKDADNAALEGDWVGVIGDTISFKSDGKYEYVENAEKFYGTYTVDNDKQTLTLKLSEEPVVYKKGEWGIDGRVFFIKGRYYFKASK